MTRVLKEIEIKDILFRGKNAPEYIITKILDELENEHPSIYRIIYGEPSDAIATINRDMANLYLDLSFDVIWVFREAFGKIPKIKDEEIWASKKLSLIDAELKSITKEIPMNDKIRKNLQERFVKNSLSSNIQFELLKHLENEVTKYASFKKRRKTAIHILNNLLFVLVRLMGDFYSSNETQKA